MNVKKTPLAGLLIIEPKIFKDDRGFFYEVFQQNRYQEHNIENFVQDNLSRSQKNTLRGLHYQLPEAQGKLVTVLKGTVWDVVVDIRLSSATFGQWFGITLSDENHLQLYIPPGFAHGFCVLSEEAEFFYKCTNFYNPATEHGIRWDDPNINIPWPITSPILSPRDQTYSVLNEMPHDKLFR